MELERDRSGSDHGGRGDHGGGAVSVGTLKAPRGFYAVCGSILAGAAVVIGFDLAHHQPGGTVQAGPRPRVVVSSPVPVVSSPGSSAAPRVRAAPPEAPTGGSTAADAGSPAALPSPASASTATVSRPSRVPSPAPGPSRVPLIEVSAVVAVAPRASSSGVVRSPAAVPGAPPFPTPGAGLVALLRVR